jgi:hypothetical protein
MDLPIYWVDAFTDRVFGGNPAAVVPLDSWLDDALLQRIANENGLSETAFFVRTGPARARAPLVHARGRGRPLRPRDAGHGARPAFSSSASRVAVRL